MAENLGIIDLDTGSLVEDGSAYVKLKSGIDKAKEMIKRKQDYELYGQQIKTEYKVYGTFIWFLYNANQVLDLGISNEDLTKLIFISTYISYSSNRLMVDNKNCMTKEDMQSLLRISDMTFWRFFKSVTEAKIIRETGDGIFLNPNIFSKGSSDKIKSVDKNRMRLYINGIRILYQKAKICEHSLLSYLYQAIPFVNINYNMLCYNPMETDIKKIHTMPFEEYCKTIGYTPDNSRRLKTKIKKLRLQRLPVFNFVDNDDGLFCYINPNVYYAGNSFKEVRVLGKFVKQ